MALDIKELRTLVKTTVHAKKDAPVAYSFGEENFSYRDLQEATRSQFQELAGNIHDFNRNAETIFELIEIAIDDYLPQRVLEQYGQFADVMTVGQGQKAIFTQRITEASRRRAKKFVTRVGLAGVYEVAKLDGKTVEVQTTAYGGAVQIGFEEYLDGRIDLSDVLEIMTEGMDEALYREIANALNTTIPAMSGVTKYSGAGFNETQLDNLLAVADAYGRATIYCTPAFAATIAPANANMWSDNMKDTMWENGWLGRYKNHNVIVLNQSFEDNTNTTKVLNDQLAFIIPTGAEKPVKIALEGTTQVRQRDNEDWSKELQSYKKMGVAVMVDNNICIYQNTSLAA